MCPLKLQQGIIYGPVRSRRLGASLGVNLLPQTYKLCTFNCVYCQYGPTTVSPLHLADRLGDLPTPDDFRKALEEALRVHQDLEYITFSGNGEATLHPQFDEMVDIARELKEMYRPEVKLTLLSNSSTLTDEKVLKALAKIDFKIMKLDAGSPQLLRQINRPRQRVDYDLIVKGLQGMENVTLQTMFVEGEWQNTDDKRVREWIERVAEIQPVGVQIYSLDRPPSEESLKKVSEEKLNQIAAQVEQTTGVPVKVFWR